MAAEAFRSLHLMDPELVATLAPQNTVELNDDTLAAARAGLANVVQGRMDAFVQQRGGPFHDRISQQTVQISRLPDEPDMRVIILRPIAAQSRARPVYLHVHGGGMIMGYPELTAGRHSLTALDHDCIVVSPAYRVAPEHKFLAAVEDLYTALKWVVENAVPLGADPRRIVVGGESAGGGLAACLALLARDRGEIKLAGQLLIYPMLDDRTGSGPGNEFAGEFGWGPAHNRYGWKSLLGEDFASPQLSHHAAAARAEDLSGLPPSFIGVGALDLFVDESIEYARRLLNAGVSTSLHVYPGAYHGFDIYADSEIGRRFIRDCNEALARLLA